MASGVAIVGDTGTGKTTSMINLDPLSTYLINLDKKNPPFPGWKKMYNRENRNYFRTYSIPEVVKRLKTISNKAPHIKTIVIDTLNAAMNKSETTRIKEPGWDKWNDLIYLVTELIDYIPSLRDDLVIVVMFHEDVKMNEHGVFYRRILVNGQKLKDYKLESRFTTVLFTRVEYGNGKAPNKYYFETQGYRSTGKSPMGMFSNFLIPNDLDYVVRRVNEFENEGILEA